MKTIYLSLFVFSLLIQQIVCYSQDLPCGEIRTGLYNYENLNTSSSFRSDFYEYLYNADFKSENDVLSAGISLETLIPGPVAGTFLPFIGSGNFDKSSYSQWRSEYSKTRQVKISYEQSFSRARQYVEIEVVKAWSNCMYINAKLKQKGIVTEIVPIDLTTVEFRATWVSVNGIPDIGIARSLEVTNGRISTPNAQNPFKKGGVIDAGDKSVIITLVPGKPLIVRLYLTKDIISDKFPAVLPGKLNKFISDKTEIFAGEPVNLGWESSGLVNLTLNNQPVSASGSRDFYPTANETYTLSGEDVFGSKIQKTLSVNVKPAPVQIVSCQINYHVPAWADDKEGPTLLNITISTEDQQTLLFSAQRGGSWDPCPIPKGQDLLVPMQRAPNIALNQLIKDKLRRVYVYLVKNPHGNDKVVLEVTGTFFLSDGKSIPFNVKQFRLEDNDDQHDSAFAEVTWP
ncbi:hypothetical protein SAMN04487995_1771 [Dyadobacter koreensis]|uniref:Uncharacterized protein n=1 Tax=Dyadobacter koreensis TaxID=408657 RepID=A0A1H6SPY3_9BACT|nr:hypothetical protein [Dyadobacter koreensis]SEI69969.1 hypothetical protein SAMN04487995_1771 [Dyadobacter koreensis]